MPASVTFLHTADWQLGKPFARVSDVAKRSALQAERLACIRRIAAEARNRQAAFVLVAGDLFDSPSPVNATVAGACEALGAMEVPVLVIPGNHDHGGPGSLWQQPFFTRQREQLAPNLRVLLAPEPAILEQAIIFPAPLLRRADAADPTAWIRTAFDRPDLPPDIPRIVLAHGSVQGFEAAADDEDEEPRATNRIDLARLPDAGIDYIALGDWHGTKQVSPKAWYSGTPETDRFPRGPDHAPGHVLVVQATRGQPPQVHQCPTGRLHWDVADHRFTDDRDLDAFRAGLDARISGRGQDSLLRLALDGSLGLAASRRLTDYLAGLDALLLRLKLEDRVAIAPTPDEVRALAERPDDPLISSVARRLLEAAGTDADAAVARLALRELHSALP